jgi:hypothetical protein
MQRNLLVMDIGDERWLSLSSSPPLSFSLSLFSFALVALLLEIPLNALRFWLSA